MSKEFLPRFLTMQHIYMTHMIKYAHQSHHMFILSTLTCRPIHFRFQIHPLGPHRPSWSRLSWPVLIEGDNILAQKSRTTSLAQMIPRCPEFGTCWQVQATSCHDKKARLHHAHSNDYEIEHIPIGITTCMRGSKVHGLHMTGKKCLLQLVIIHNLFQFHMCVLLCLFACLVGQCNESAATSAQANRVWLRRMGTQHRAIMQFEHEWWLDLTFTLRKYEKIKCFVYI